MSTENKTVESIPAITIRFAGDSGDGMQLVGTRFTDTSAVFGNDLATLPAFPAEIRAPQGTCLLYTSPSPRDGLLSRMPSSA